MRYGSHLFLRVEPALPAAVALAARAEGIGSSEFIRRAVKRALPGVRSSNDDDDRDPPPPAAPSAALPMVA